MVYVPPMSSLKCCPTCIWRRAGRFVVFCWHNNAVFLRANSTPGIVMGLSNSLPVSMMRMPGTDQYQTRGLRKWSYALFGHAAEHLHGADP